MATTSRLRITAQDALVTALRARQASEENHTLAFEMGQQILRIERLFGMKPIRSAPGLDIPAAAAQAAE